MALLIPLPFGPGLLLSHTASALTPQALLDKCRAMAPHLSNAEVDSITTMSQQGKTTSGILDRITRGRHRQGVDPPELRAIQRAIAGETGSPAAAQGCPAP